jgi:uncharacterized membrane protein YfcA
MEYLVLIFIGLFAATLGALVGIGGGVIIVPLLVFFGVELGILDRVTPQTAVGTSSLVLVFIGLSAMMSYGRSNQLDKKNGFLFLIGIVPGALIGSYTSSLFSLDSFRLFFGLFLVGLSILLLIRNKIKPLSIFQKDKYVRPHVDNMGEIYHYGFPPYIAILGSFLAGFSAGLFGIGGGAVMTPMMLLLFLMPASIAIGTSMMLVFFGGFASAVGHFLQGNIDYMYALLLIPSAYIGAKIGVVINQKFESDKTVSVLRIVLLLLGIYTMIQSFI